MDGTWCSLRIARGVTRSTSPISTTDPRASSTPGASKRSLRPGLPGPPVPDPHSMFHPPIKTGGSPMRGTPMRRLVACVLVLACALSIGCAKKAAVKPPEPPAPPPQSTIRPTETPRDTAETPTPTPTTRFSSSDLQPVFFDLDSYSLRPDARTALDQDAKLLRD